VDAAWQHLTCSRGIDIKSVIENGMNSKGDNLDPLRSQNLPQLRTQLARDI